MNILWNLHSFNINGVLKAALSLIKHLSNYQIKYNIIVCSPYGGNGRTLLESYGVKTILFSKQNDIQNYLDSQKIIPQIIIRESLFSPDIKNIADLYNAKYFIRVHEVIPIDSVSDNWFINSKTALEYFKEIKGQNVIYVSNLIEEYYKALNMQFEIRSHVVMPTIMEDELSLASTDIFPNGFRILQLGTIYPRKGSHLTLSAFHLFLKKYQINDASLIFIGDRSANEKEKIYSESLKQQVLALGLNHKVSILPMTKKPFQKIKDFDVLTLHSTSECTPLAIFESMFLGKKAICTNVGGVSEQIKDDRLGYLFKYGDIEQQADLFYKVYQERNRIESSEEIKRIYRKLFSSHMLNTKLCEIYEIQ